MFEDNFSFSDSIEIVPTIEEPQVEKKEIEEKKIINENKESSLEPTGPIIIDEIKNENEEKKVEKRESIRNSRNDSNQRNSSFQHSNRQRAEIITRPSLRQKALYETTSLLYMERFTEYAGIPDFIVNQLFGINDNKGSISTEEAIIMLINLFPNTRDKVNSAKYLEDAIKIGKVEIINYLYKECKFGFSNIPLHSRDNLSKKITSDVENSNFEASLYDYQLMRISGYLRNN